jgi:hypothetical protein
MEHHRPMADPIVAALALAVAVVKVRERRIARRRGLLVDVSDGRALTGRPGLERRSGSR